MQSIIDLCPPGKRLDLVIDTDAYNEIDDQFAIILALFCDESSPAERISPTS